MSTKWTQSQVDAHEARRTPHRAGRGVAREAELHDAILAECRSHGWPVVHSRMDRPHTSGVGTPDFVIALPGGYTLWLEAKAGGAKLRPEQAAWMAALKRQGHWCAVVRSVEEFRLIVFGGWNE